MSDDFFSFSLEESKVSTCDIAKLSKTPEIDNRCHYYSFCIFVTQALGKDIRKKGLLEFEKAGGNWTGNNYLRNLQV